MSVFNPPVPSSPTPTPTPKPNKPKTIHPSKTQKPHQISLPIASVTASFLPSAGVIIASETLAPNGPAVIVNGTPVRVDKSGNIIVAPTSVSALVVGDSTIKKGGEGITVDRTVISVGSDGRVGSSVVSSSSSTDGGVTSQSDTSIPGDGTTSVPPDEATSSVASDRNVPTPTSPNGIPSTTGPGYLDPLGTDGAIIAGKASSIKSGGILLCICIGMRAILLIG